MLISHNKNQIKTHVVWQKMQLIHSREIGISIASTMILSSLHSVYPEQKMAPFYVKNFVRSRALKWSSNNKSFFRYAPISPRCGLQSSPSSDEHVFPKPYSADCVEQWFTSSIETISSPNFDEKPYNFCISNWDYIFSITMCHKYSHLAKGVSFSKSPLRFVFETQIAPISRNVSNKLQNIEDGSELFGFCQAT